MTIHLSGLRQSQRHEVASDHPPATAFVVPIAKRASAIVFDRPARAAPIDRRARLLVISGEGVVRGPVVSTELDTQRGAVRHLALVETTAEQLVDSGASVLRGDLRIATLDADWLQTPVRGSAALFHDLAFSGRTRLLKLLLANAASLFRIGEDPAFTQMLADLVSQTTIPEVRVESICDSGDGAVLTIIQSDEVRDIRHARIAFVARERAGVVVGASLCRDASRDVAARDNGRVHIHLPRAPRRHSHLIGFCGAATPFVANFNHLRAISFVEWLRRASPAAQAWGCQRLHASVQPGAPAHAPVRGLEADPEFALHSAAATEAGVLLAADLADPRRQVRAVIVERDGMSSEIAIETLAGGAPIASTTPLCGFFEAPRGGVQINPVRIRLAHHGGRIQTVAEQPISPFSGGVDAVLARAGAGESLSAARRRAAQAIARAMATRERRPIAVRTTRYGGNANQSRLTLVAPMPADPDIVRARSAAVFAQGGGDVGFVYHWAAHAGDAAQLAALEDVHALHAAPHLAVVTESHATDAERLQAALRMTEGPVILLGPSVVPFSPGWMGAWLKVLAAPSPVSVVGATLLSVHGSVLDAGGRVSITAAGDLVVAPRFRRGGAIDSRRTAATGWASAAAVGLKPLAVGALRESVTPMRNPDYLVVETIARLKTSGSSAVTLLHAPFVDFAGQTPQEPLSAAVDSILLADSLRAIGDMDPNPKREATR